ncbi:hypothetical protein M407DRAFT_33201 [Tulasnella calospora MUT 4182]|uniref:Uncharacterized protein n=1 Tax=Tulasnella calospora MUT 4182 TaxID=1051891 RepID=A0A0C3Q2Q5_9AGAM|nr:hypothetical protein M407DRAFT_33201 [Tulasnella calospora MUT 4182]
MDRKPAYPVSSGMDPTGDRTPLAPYLPLSFSDIVKPSEEATRCKHMDWPVVVSQRAIRHMGQHIAVHLFPLPIPYLDEQAFQWYPSFDHLGEFLQNPNLTSAVDALARTPEDLIDKCASAGSRIHLFGFPQGGAVAVEPGLHWWSLHRDTSQSSK